MRLKSNAGVAVANIHQSKIHLQDGSDYTGSIKTDRFRGTIPSISEDLAYRDTVSSSFFQDDRPFFVKIDEGGLVPALEKLDGQLRAAGQTHILSKKKPVSWTGREIGRGQMGLINHGGHPKILIKPGYYPRFPLANWWARDFRGCKPVSDSVIHFNGLTIVQVAQNQAAVVSDLNNKIFIVKNGGFVALPTQGSYDVLGIVDQGQLSQVVKDKVTGAILGYKHEVKMTSVVGVDGRKKAHLAALFLDIPAGNGAILQKGNELQILTAGQHSVLDPSTTLRSFFTCGESQAEWTTKDITTRDQVPISFTINLQWQLEEPFKLTTRGYDVPYDALRDQVQSILTRIVANLDYGLMVERRIPNPNKPTNGGSDPDPAFLDKIRTRAIDDLHTAAQEYGISLKDFAIVSREAKGEMAEKIDRLAVDALQAQIDAANAERENAARLKEEQRALEAQVAAQKAQAEAESEAILANGRLSTHVSQLKAESDARRAQHDAESDAFFAKARARTQALQIQAEADSAARRSQIDAESDAFFANARASVQALQVQAQPDAEATRQSQVDAETNDIIANARAKTDALRVQVQAEAETARNAVSSESHTTHTTTPVSNSQVTQRFSRSETHTRSVVSTFQSKTFTSSRFESSGGLSSASHVVTGSTAGMRVEGSSLDDPLRRAESPR